MLDLVTGDPVEPVPQRLEDAAAAAAAAATNGQRTNETPDKSKDPTPPTDVVIKRPLSTGPMIPPPNCDLNVTILILPTLESYASTVSHGIRSRTWKKNHDGLSFKIEHLKWVVGTVGMI
ncbi:hypothetical protein GP486_008985, partial [Trichoglossum hirsutum]